VPRTAHIGAWRVDGQRLCLHRLGPAAIDEAFAREIPEHVRPSFPRLVKVAVIGLLVWLGPLLVLLAAAIYACYTFLVGATVLKKCDSDKAIPYTLVVLLCAIVLSYIVRLAVVGIAFSAMTGVSAARLLH